MCRIYRPYQHRTHGLEGYQTSKQGSKDSCHVEITHSYKCQQTEVWLMPYSISAKYSHIQGVGVHLSCLSNKAPYVLCGSEVYLLLGSTLRI